MNYLRIAQSIALVAASLQIVACEKTVTKYADTDYSQITKLARESEADDIQHELEMLSFDEYFLSSKISGENTPEEFKSFDLDPTNYIFGLNFESDHITSSRYLMLVDELTISCDGKVEYTKGSFKQELTFDQFLFSAKWRPLRFKACGKISVPKGKKLFVYAKEESILENLELETNSDSHLSLRLPGVKYSGSAPKISVAPYSILKLNFN